MSVVLRGSEVAVMILAPTTAKMPEAEVRKSLNLVLRRLALLTVRPSFGCVAIRSAPGLGRQSHHARTVF